MPPVYDGQVLIPRLYNVLFSVEISLTRKENISYYPSKIKLTYMAYYLIRITFRVLNTLNVMMNAVRHIFLQLIAS